MTGPVAGQGRCHPFTSILLVMAGLCVLMAVAGTVALTAHLEQRPAPGFLGGTR